MRLDDPPPYPQHLSQIHILVLKVCGRWRPAREPGHMDQAVIMETQVSSSSANNVGPVGLQIHCHSSVRHVDVRIAQD